MFSRVAKILAFISVFLGTFLAWRYLAVGFLYVVVCALVYLVRAFAIYFFTADYIPPEDIQTVYKNSFVEVQSVSKKRIYTNWILTSVVLVCAIGFAVVLKMKFLS